MMLSRSLYTIPQADDDPIRWDYFVLQAARGSVRVPRMLLLAVPGMVGERFGLHPMRVENDHVESFANKLPNNPDYVLRSMLKNAEAPLPELGQSVALLDLEVRTGSFRPPVPSPDLLHDAALVVLSDYGPDGFFRAFEAAEEGPDWDSVAAVAAMMFLIVGRTVGRDLSPGVIGA